MYFWRLKMELQTTKTIFFFFFGTIETYSQAPLSRQKAGLRICCHSQSCVYLLYQCRTSTQMEFTLQCAPQAALDTPAFGYRNNLWINNLKQNMYKEEKKRNVKRAIWHSISLTLWEAKKERKLQQVFMPTCKNLHAITTHWSWKKSLVGISMKAEFQSHALILNTITPGSIKWDWLIKKTSWIFC